MALLDEIEAFLARTEISATALGQRALGDRHFVRQLRMGRRVWPETEAKVRQFMAEQPDGGEGAGENHAADSTAAPTARSPGKSGAIAPSSAEAA